MTDLTVQIILKKLKAAGKEIEVLYELSEAEQIILASIIADLPIGAMSPKLLGKLLRAAAHFLESIDEIVDEVNKEKGQ